ncbi:Ff.00g126890.m01.CDS01 [Fusarium sp. VM40]|nr:Ff.00g126890.m01.CDS01 [Fusarium sp. VM40]
MSNIWPSTASQDEPQPDALIDVADTGEIADLPGEAEQPDLPPVPPPPTWARPPLQRNTLQGAPPAAPMALPPSSDQPPATDSLSLQQLRHIVAEFNRAEPVAYDFEYTDIGPHAEEIDEWFNYGVPQWVRLSAAQRAFKWHWQHEARSQDTWDDADNDTRTRFVQTAIAGVQSNDAALRSASIGKLVYLVLGRWNDTAMSNATPGDSRSVASISQLQAIKAGVECLTSLEGLPVIWEALRSNFEVQWSGDPLGQHSNAQEAQDELMNLMTIMYVVVQETLNDPEDMSSSYGKLLELNPSLVDYMFTATSKLRWDEQNAMPQTQILLLFWKTILLVFGGTKDLEAIKKATNEMGDKAADKKTITASPLDYHVFRQEITSKYPAYVPPRPAIPLEADNTSLLPPLSSQVSRNNGANGIIPAPPQVHSGGTSILDQPVHIATPAPSPPPSPAAGGKGVKKQNYQTNQNFPFMYPPLDASSNFAGGKGAAGLQHELIGRKWEGSDIPASILEAGELFSQRVRMTRATRQLWEERERFLKFERGYSSDRDDDDDIEGLDLNELSPEEQEILKEIKAETRAEEKRENPVAPEPEIDYGPRPELLDERDKQRLVAVEKFYRDALPHLQSLVIVLLRPILLNVTAIVSQQPQQGPPGMGRGNNPGMNGGPSGNRQQQEVPGQNPTKPLTPELSLDEVDAARTREITSKAMTGILILLLKWLRVSHVLKFEYMTQLLLDSNYVPLVLKLFAHQDVQQVVDSKMDRAENSFFHFCNLLSQSRDKTTSELAQDEEEDDEEIEESDDEAAPPPIRRRRSPSTQVDDDGDSNSDGQASSTRPEVDELGYPLNSQPMEPITDFSRRNFFSLINYLRVMQKICKNKAHRNLLLVQYKSSTILRKSLKVPQPELRLYTLKLFKNQVPYCGRKWRQSNMRVITAIYLHCRPELKDEWLAGSDVDAEVDAALPLEQALRSLTHWLNVRRYPDKIAPEIRAAMRDEQDFFSRELEKLELDWTGGGGDDGMSELEAGEAW